MNGRTYFTRQAVNELRAGRSAESRKLESLICTRLRYVLCVHRFCQSDRKHATSDGKV